MRRPVRFAAVLAAATVAATIAGTAAARQFTGAPAAGEAAGALAAGEFAGAPAAGKAAGAAAAGQFTGAPAAATLTATLLLFTNGRQYLAYAGDAPPAPQLRLGAATGPAHRARDGLWRRRFACGSVTVRPAGDGTRGTGTVKVTC